MKTRKDPRGRKPEKDKKECIRLYLRNSKIKELGGKTNIIERIYSLIDQKQFYN